MSTADGQAVMSPLPLGSSPFMQGILETNTFPANEQRHNITAPVECRRSSRLQAVPAFKQEMSQSIAIPGRPGTGTSTSTVAEGNPDFRPSSAGDVSHSCAHLSRRSSSGLLQGSSNVRPASAVDRLYSSSTSSAGGEGLLQASTGFRPASAGGTCSSSASPSRQGGSGLLQARLNVTEALGKDIPYTISVNGSPPSDADQETLISRRNPSSADRHSMSKNPAHYSSTLMEPNEEGDGQRLLTSLKSHRASSFRHREDAAGLSRKLQRALQACERARRLYWDNGALVMLTSALIMSCGALAVALIDDRVPVFEIVMIRSLASLLLSLIVAKAQGVDRWFGSRKLWPYLAARGFTGAASMTLYYEGIARMPLADAMTIMYSNPVLCAVLGWAFRAERVGSVGGLGITVTLLGVVFVAQPPVIFGGHEWSHARMAGTIMAFFAAVTAALAFFVIGYIPKTEPSLVLAIWFHAASLASSVPFIAAGYPDMAVLPGRFDWAMLGMVITTSFLGQVLLNRAFQISNASKASSINCVQVLCAHVFGVTLLQESETVLGLAGSAAIAAGVVTVNSAKIAKVESGPLAEGIRGSALVQYTPVVTSPYAADSGEASPGESSPDVKILPGRNSWQEWSAHATRQLADIQSLNSLDGADASEEAQLLHVSDLTGQLTRQNKLARESKAADKQLGSGDISEMGAAGSLLGFKPGSWIVGGPSMLSPRQHRSSVELQRVDQAGGIPRKSNGLASELSESHTVETRDQGSRRAAEGRTNRSSLDRGQNLHDREPSFGDWHFKRVPGHG